MLQQCIWNWYVQLCVYNTHAGDVIKYYDKIHITIVLGKSTTLSNIQSIFGLDPKEANTHQTTAASLSNQACATTLPVG
jgi:ABC-type tungstate transport system permease subunit